MDVSGVHVLRTTMHLIERNGGSRLLRDKGSGRREEVKEEGEGSHVSGVQVLRTTMHLAPPFPSSRSKSKPPFLYI